MPAGSRSDPLGKHRFRVEIDGITTAGFTNVTGLRATIEQDQQSVPSEDNNDDQPGRPLPRNPFRPGQGGSKSLEYEDVAQRLRLTRGITGDDQLWQWFESWRRQDDQKRTVLIFLLNDVGEEAVVWECKNAFPTAYIGPRLNAQDPGVATETFELQYARLHRRTR